MSTILLNFADKTSVVVEGGVVVLTTVMTMDEFEQLSIVGSDVEDMEPDADREPENWT